MSTKVIKLIIIVFFLGILAEIIYLIILQPSVDKKLTYFYLNYFDFAPKNPPITRTLKDELNYIRINPKNGAIIVDFKNNPDRKWGFADGDPNVFFYLDQGGNKTKLSFSQMKKLIEDGTIKGGDIAEFILTQTFTKAGTRSSRDFQQFTIFR